MDDALITLADTDTAVDILEIAQLILAAILGWFSKAGKDRWVTRNGR